MCPDVSERLIQQTKSNCEDISISILVYNCTKSLRMSPGRGRISFKSTAPRWTTEACLTLQRKWKNTFCDLLSWRQNEEGYYSIRGLSFDIWPQMCSSGVIPVTLIPQVLLPHRRRDALASLNCNELIMPGHCSRFRHSQREGIMAAPTAAVI